MATVDRLLSERRKGDDTQISLRELIDEMLGQDPALDETQALRILRANAAKRKRVEVEARLRPSPPEAVSEAQSRLDRLEAVRPAGVTPEQTRVAGLKQLREVEQRIPTERPKPSTPAEAFGLLIKPEALPPLTVRSASQVAGAITPGAVPVTEPKPPGPRRRDLGSIGTDYARSQHHDLRWRHTRDPSQQHPPAADHLLQKISSHL